MQKDIKKFYRRYKRGQKTAFATVADYLLGSILFYIIAKLILQEAGFMRPVSSILATALLAISLLILHIINDIALERYIQRARNKAKRNKTKKEMPLMPRKDFIELANSIAVSRGYKDYYLHAIMCASNIDENMILSGYKAAKQNKREFLVIACSCDVTQTAGDYINDIDSLKVEIITAGDLTELLQKRNPISDEQADSMLKKEFELQRRKHEHTFRKFAKQKRALPYITCGATLLLMSLFLRYSLYYRLISALCFNIGGFIFLKHRLTH